MRSLTAAVVLSLCMAGCAAAETLRLTPVSRAVVEDRLGQYGGTNNERQAALKRMFIEAGLIGSRFYARAMTPEQLAATDAMDHYFDTP